MQDVSVEGKSHSYNAIPELKGTERHREYLNSCAYLGVTMLFPN